MSSTLISPTRFAVMLRELFTQQREYIEEFFSQVDLVQAEKFLEMILSCKGVIFFTGVGKSGAVAQKIATTFTSIGTRALFLSPTDTLHGDLGIVSDQDLVVFLSKSGESDELIKMLPYVRAKGAHVASLVSKPRSRLGIESDLLMILPLRKELCPFDLAPTTSASLQLIFGDILAVALMHAKGFSLDEYARNHPAGRIGKRMTLRVKDVMIHGDALPVVGPKTKLATVLSEISAKSCGCMLVVDEQNCLLGIFTDGDLRRSLEQEGAGALVKDMGSLMTPKPRCTSPDLLAYEALQEMEANSSRPIYILPVVKAGALCGLIRMHDLIQAGI